MASQPIPRVLFKEKDPTRAAFLAKDAKISISGEHLPQFDIEGEDLLLGTVELFLASGTPPPARLCTVAINPEAQLKEVGLDEVLRLALKYEYGINANRFLAMLLEQTNDLIRAMFRLMPREWRVYQERAILFHRIVNRWAGLATRIGVREYQAFADRCKEEDLFVAGARFRQERSVSCIAFGSGWLNSAQRCTTDQAICRAGDLADCLYILLEGSVHVAKPNQIIATITEPGECFGELAFFLQGKRTADLIATAGTALLRLDTAALQEFHETHPDMFIQIASTVAKRIQANLMTLERHHATQPEQAASEIAALEQSARETTASFMDQLRQFLKTAPIYEVSDFISYAQDEIAKQ